MRLASLLLWSRAAERPGATEFAFMYVHTNGEWGVVPGTLAADLPITSQRQARLTLTSGEQRIVPIDLRLLRSPAGPEPTARQIAINLPDQEIAAVEVIVDGEHLVVPPAVLGL